MQPSTAAASPAYSFGTASSALSSLSSSAASPSSRRSPWNLHDMSTALPSWPEKPSTARRRPRDSGKGDEDGDGDEDEEDDFSESVSEVERKAVGLHAEVEADGDYDMRPFVTSSLLPSPAVSRPYSPISSSSSRPVSRLSSRSSVNSSIRPSPSSSLPSSHRSSLSSSTSAALPPPLVRSASRLRDLPEFECGKYVNSGRLAAECGHYPNLHNLLQLQREREAVYSSNGSSREGSYCGRRSGRTSGGGRHMRYASVSVSGSPSVLSSIEQSSEDDEEEAAAAADERGDSSSIAEGSGNEYGEEDEDEDDSEVHPPIVLGNFFSRQPVSCAVEESKLAVEFNGGSVSIGRLREDSGSEEGRSRPVSSRGSRRSGS